MQLITVKICGIVHQVRRSWYDWVTHVAHNCHNSYTGWNGGLVYPGEWPRTPHDRDCKCSKCEAWREADRLSAIMHAEEVQPT